MAQCYSCGCELTDKNKSLEHIIPNALGGKLESEDILCESCNNNLSHIDASLTKNFKFLSVVIAPKRDRDSNIEISVKINSEDAKLRRDKGCIFLKTEKITGKGKAKQLSLGRIFSSNDKIEIDEVYKDIQQSFKKYTKKIFH